MTTDPFELNNFFFDLPIYTPILIDAKNIESLMALLQGAYKQNQQIFNGYNPVRKSESSFVLYSVNVSYSTAQDYIEFGGIARFTIKCKRWEDEMFFFAYFNRKESKFMKVGQYPSIADFHIHEIKQYTKVLSKEKLREFTRAIGLAANGVGIGSFVYLRRIFESLIEEAHGVAQGEHSWDEEQFLRARMAEKIQLLETHLPPFLVENKSLYGILSTGIHGLTEEDCLAHFDTVRVGIELILDEKLEAFERKRKVEEAKQKLAALTNKLRDSGN